MQVGVNGDKKLNISENCLKVLERRYLKKDKTGKVIETPEEMFRRVASHIASADKLYGVTDKEVKEIENNFYNIMSNFEFMPNSPTLMNAGKDLGQLSACFTPDQVVITKSGPKRISEIKNGELVLTHKNRFKRVTEIFIRESNTVYILNAYKLPTETLKVTGEHPVLAVKKGNNGDPAWIQIKDLSLGDYVALSFPKEVVDLKDIEIISFINDNKLVDIGGSLYEKNTDIRCSVRKDGSLYVQHRNRSGEISKQVAPVKNRLEVDTDLMRLFGYYLSEGCVSDNNALRFTFSEKERNYCEDVLKIVKEKFGASSRVEETNSPDQRWLSIRFHSKILARFFENLFGTGYASKKIPSWITLLPVEKQKGLLAGMFRGDSCTFKNGNNFSTRLVMCNMNLVYAAWQLVMRAGHFAALNSESMPKLGRTLPFRCTVSGKSGTKLMRECLDIDFAHNGKSYIRTIVRGNTLLTPITKIIKQPYQGKVYNLEIEEDHSYCANMVSVHNCFVLPVEDSMESIFDAIKNTAMIHKSGGGTGFSFSRLRAKNSVVRSTGGVSSGPVSFMKVFNSATQAVKQGGTRRGANMGILRIDHPDILEFIKCKENDKDITNFNISVAITEDFMNKVIEDKEYDLIDPHTEKPISRLKAKEVFDLIVEMAWKNGEPGIVFIDRINKDNPTPKLGEIESTNPCGEQPILPFESCNLGSINLSKVVSGDTKKKIDWEKLKKLTHLTTHFLDNVIDMNKFPLEKIKDMTRKNRKIGLGVMGWADMLIQLGIPYNSDEAVELAEKVMNFIDEESKKKSEELAGIKGAFPSYSDSVFSESNIGLRRNATLTTIAPTGTISIISNTSSGIEPLFALSYYRKVMDNDKLIEVNPLFEKVAKKEGFYSRKLMENVADKGSIKDIDEVPDKYKKIFVTSHDIAPIWHIRMQAAFQGHTDNAVSKTVNFPHDAKKEDVSEVYMLAYKLGCKGVTIYRDKSREEQVLNISSNETKSDLNVKSVVKDKSVAPRPRPVVTTGTTTKVATGCGNLYITINVDDRSMPFEVFIQMGKAGGCAASQLEAIGRLVSLALRSGVENKKIIDQLRGIRCPSPSWEKGGRIFSCADAISRVLELRLGNGQMHHKSEESEKHSPHTMIEDKLGNVVGVCPDCGASLRHEEGCVVCRSCGYSKC